MRQSRRKRKRKRRREKEGEEEERRKRRWKKRGKRKEKEGEVVKEEKEEGGKHYRGLDCEWPPVSSLSRAAPKCVSQAEGRSQPGLRSRISRRAENWSERRRGEARRTQGAL